MFLEIICGSGAFQDVRKDPNRNGIFFRKEVSSEVMALGVFVCLTTKKLILILFLLIQQVYITTMVVFWAMVVSV
jgi:hypothetical protein